MNNIEFKDIENMLSALTERIQKIEHMENIPVKEKELAEQQALAADPAFWNDNQKAKVVTQKIDALKSAIETTVINTKLTNNSTRVNPFFFFILSPILII